MFGWLKRKQSAPAGAQTTAGGGDGGKGGFPWDGDPANVACNLAAGNIANNLPRFMTTPDNRLHAETYVAAVGAVAGFAAQRTVFAVHAGAPLQQATLPNGDKFLFGDLLNNQLFAQTEADAKGRVWPVAASAAVAAGLPMDKVPSTEKMFAHVSTLIASGKEGMPSITPHHHPHATPQQLLKTLWPRVITLFRGDFDDFHRKFGAVPQKWWGPVAAFGCGKPITDVKRVLAPDIALTILMETAIYASKIDPATIPEKV